MNDETVVPLRPGFDNEFRGFNRGQVLEHIELLEDQVRILIADRDEAIRLNEDQRRITDETRQRMEEMSAELNRLENSETGVPQATRRMQNLLRTADQEAGAIREHARRDAETIRGTASTDAEQIRKEAEAHADSLRQECASLVSDLEKRREQLDAEHAARTAELENEREELRKMRGSAYEDAVASGQRDATEMLRKSAERCERMEAESRRYHAEIVADLQQRARELDNARKLLTELLDTVNGFATAHRAELDKLAAIRSLDELERAAGGSADDEGTGQGNTGQGNTGQDDAGQDEARQEPTRSTESPVSTRIPVQSGQDAARRRDPAAADQGEATLITSAPAHVLDVDSSTSAEQRN